MAENRGSKPGERRGGRKKGVPNKFTADVRAAIEQAFNRAGGVDYLVQVAKDDPRVFCTLLAKVLPTQITGADDKDLIPKKIELIIVDAKNRNS